MINITIPNINNKKLSFKNTICKYYNTIIYIIKNNLINLHERLL